MPHPRTALHRAADGFAKPSRACFSFQYLDEFHLAFEPLVDALEAELSPRLRDAGASDELLHEWALAVAALQDFLPALADEIARRRTDR